MILVFSPFKIVRFRNDECQGEGAESAWDVDGRQCWDGQDKNTANVGCAARPTQSAGATIGSLIGASAHWRLSALEKK